MKESLYHKLIRAARATSPDDRVPWAFEKRVMAQLRPAPREDWSAITRSLWWSAAACCAIAGALSVWTGNIDSPDAANFSSELEQTILASIDDFRLEPDGDLTDFERELEILQ